MNRGRDHRPTTLDVCCVCGNLRGIWSTFDNLCRCDVREWIGEVPRAGDLYSDVRLCCACLIDPVVGRSRWTPFYCDDGRPAFIAASQLVGRPIAPLGPHSMMNGLFWQPKGTPEEIEAQADAFYGQLHALCVGHERLHEVAWARTLERLDQLGFGDRDAVVIDEYWAACEGAGITLESSFPQFLDAIGTQIPPELVATIWAERHSNDGRRKSWDDD